MPFTLAHPAAVLPLARRPFVALALAAGAMAPDVPYYVRSTNLPVTAESWYEPLVNATTTHSVAGLVPVDLVLSAALWAAMVVSIPALAALVLGWTAVRLPVPRPTSAVGVVVAMAWTAVSLVLGAATHVLWDGITHGEPLAVRLAPFLADSAVGPVTWAGLLQQVSTVLGLVVVGGYLARAWRRRPPERAAPSRRRVLGVLGTVALVALVGGGVVAASREWGTSDLPLRTVLEAVVYDLAVGGVVAVTVLTAVAVTTWWVRRALAR